MLLKDPDPELELLAKNGPGFADHVGYVLVRFTGGIR
jgi:hypothetical protein